MVSRKEGTLGLGRRSHEPAKGNEWWLKGFESALSSVGASGASTPGTGTSTPVGPNATNGREAGKETREKQAQEELQRKVNAQLGRFGGLYSYFCRGEEMLEGTLGDLVTPGADGKAGSGSRKRKSDVFSPPPTDLSASSDVEIAEGQRKKRRKTKPNGVSTTNGVLTSKSQKEQHRKTKQDPTSDFAEMKTFLSVRDAEIDKKRRKREKEEKRKMRESQAFKVTEAFLGAVEREEGREKARRRGRYGGVDGGDEGAGGEGEDLVVDGEGEDVVVDGEDGSGEGVDGKRRKSRKGKQRRMVTTESGDEREETREERRIRREERRVRKKRRKEGE